MAPKRRRLQWCSLATVQVVHYWAFVRTLLRLHTEATGSPAVQGNAEKLKQSPLFIKSITSSEMLAKQKCNKLLLKVLYVWCKLELT